MIIATGIVLAALAAYVLMLTFVVRLSLGWGSKIVNGLGAVASYASYLYVFIVFNPSTIAVICGIVVITLLTVVVFAYLSKKYSHA